jgi:hypothetical protein
MNILRFKKPAEAQPPKIKRKRQPRLRLVADSKDVRLSRAVFDAGLAAFVARLRESCEYVYVERDGHRASIFVCPTIRDMPQYTYIVRRKDGAIVDMSGCKRGRVVGNIAPKNRTHFCT